MHWLCRRTRTKQAPRLSQSFSPARSAAARNLDSRPAPSSSLARSAHSAATTPTFTSSATRAPTPVSSTEFRRIMPAQIPRAGDGNAISEEPCGSAAVMHQTGRGGTICTAPQLGNELSCTVHGNYPWYQPMMRRRCRYCLMKPASSAWQLARCYWCTKGLIQQSCLNATV